MNRKVSNLPEGVSFDMFERSELSCPNCDSKGLSVFYTVNDIPVHSCLLMSSREQAVEYPTGRLELSFCPACGFVCNTVFDPATNSYSAQYEETQGFSACFSAFAKSLAERVIDKYDIRNKTVLEIGCGKGEFLALMCQLGNNKGIGFDPAYVPSRNPAADISQIKFIQDLYSEKYADLKADVICCRHTLEHIGPTKDFMQTLRRTIGDRKGTLLFFELPDVMRVLNEGAFWDIYYEHCTYFTAGSLARLFRQSGFDIDDLYLDYDGQYLITTAYPADGPTSSVLDREDDLGLLTEAFRQFPGKCAGRIAYWRDMIRNFADEGQKVVIWGSGSKGVAFLTTLKIGELIEYVVDINPYRHGKYMPGSGHQIVSPKFMADYRPDKVIVMNPIYCEEIQHDLDRLNVKAGLLAV
jgi:SAM-dependent methyltransferase